MGKMEVAVMRREKLGGGGLDDNLFGCYLSPPRGRGRGDQKLDSRE